SDGCVRCSSGCSCSCGGRLDAAGYENCEWIAGTARPDRRGHVGEPGLLQKPRQCGIGEPAPAITEPFGDPFLVVLAEIEDEHPATRRNDAGGLVDRGSRIGGVVQCLRQYGEIDRRIPQRDALDFTLPPGDVPDPAAARQRTRTFEDRPRAIDGDDSRGPPARLYREVAVAAP